jgi:signal transduction histidine kinase
MFKRREGVLALFVAAFVVVALLTTFAIELSNTQAKSKRDVEARVHERAILAAALIDSLFGSVQQNLPQDTALYGSRHVNLKTLETKRGNNLYLAVLDSGDHVLGTSSGLTAQARADFARSKALALVHSGHLYGLGDVLPYGSTGVINFALKFPTPYGERILLSGLKPTSLASFITGELRKIPGVKGSSNYLLDGGDTVIASTNPKRPAGYVFRQPAQITALNKSKGERLGHYYDQVPLANSSERILLSAPDGPLFASVSGARKWVPWAIFLASVLLGVAALVFGRRSLKSANEVRDANAQLALVNAELADSNAKLEHRAEELTRSNAELEQFASIASHDLQEPLRKVRTFTQQVTVSESENLSERGRDYLERTNAAAERMQNLIEDLLKFSRVATHGRPFSAVDLQQVTSEVLGDLEAQVEGTGALVEVGSLPTIRADSLQMRQLMQNLISNALKFRRDGVTPEVRIAGAADGEMATITVSDNGIGFEPQYSHRIFRVFERLHGRSEYPGTGIGLALCRKIAERHGGNVIADGVLGVGASFTVTLPVHGDVHLGREIHDDDGAPVAVREEEHVLA